MNDIKQLHIKTSTSLDDGKMFKHPFHTSYDNYNSEDKWHSFVIKASGLFFTMLFFSFERAIIDHSRTSEIKEAFLTCLANMALNFTLPDFLKEYLSSVYSNYLQDCRQHLDSHL